MGDGPEREDKTGCGCVLPFLLLIGAFVGLSLLGAVFQGWLDALWTQRASDQAATVLRPFQSGFYFVPERSVNIDGDSLMTRIFVMAMVCLIPSLMLSLPFIALKEKLREKVVFSIVLVGAFLGLIVGPIQAISAPRAYAVFEPEKRQIQLWESPPIALLFRGPAKKTRTIPFDEIELFFPQHQSSTFRGGSHGHLLLRVITKEKGQTIGRAELRGGEFDVMGWFLSDEEEAAQAKELGDAAVKYLDQIVGCDSPPLIKAYWEQKAQREGKGGAQGE